MSQNKKTQTSASQNVTSLSGDKIIISRGVLLEVLNCLALTTPIITGETRPPERCWSAIKAVRLYRAKKILRRALANGNSERGDI